MNKIALFFTFCLLATQLFSQQKEVLIEGVVSSQGLPIVNAHVLVKGTTKGVRTGKEGNYLIKAKSNDILVFSFVGMHTLAINLEEGKLIVNAELEPKVEELNEVVVKKKRAFTQKQLLSEYLTNKRLIKTSLGIVDQNVSAFPIQVIDGENLIPIGTDFLYSLQNFYPKMQVFRDDFFNPKVYLGGRSPAIFDVDGVIYEQAPTFIAVNDIERVAILVRSGAISRYGPQGVGGVIIINTKSQARMDDMGVERTYDNSDLRDSLIIAVNSKEKHRPSIPVYMKKFTSLKSQQGALRHFNKLESAYGASPYFYLEVSDYFKKKWNNTKKATEILSTLETKFSDNVPTLKAAAYYHEEMGQFESALKIYLKILNLQSKDAQSHRDVANGYMEIDNYQSALLRYAQYERAVNALDSIAFDPYGTDILMTTESTNIIQLKKKSLSVDKNITNATKKNPSSRLLLEWNQKETEFEIQIVSPNGGYHTWKNTSNTDDRYLLSQRLKGYTSKQFFLDDDDVKGEWQVNINHLGNKSSTPTYLKATAFFDYGKPTQKKVLHIFKLTEPQMDTSLLLLNTITKSISK